MVVVCNPSLVVPLACGTSLLSYSIHNAILWWPSAIEAQAFLFFTIASYVSYLQAVETSVTLFQAFYSLIGIRIVRYSSSQWSSLQMEQGLLAVLEIFRLLLDLWLYEVGCLIEVKAEDLSCCMTPDLAVDYLVFLSRHSLFGSCSLVRYLSQQL